MIELLISVDDEDLGRVKLELLYETPVLTANFIKLVMDHKYDGSELFKMRHGCYIQGGDIEYSLGIGGYSGFGQKIYEGEIPKDLNKIVPNHYKLCMLNNGPHSTGSQFIILLGEAASWIDSYYPVFGYVADGFHVLEEIQKIEVNDKEYLMKRVVIKKATVLN